MRKFLERAFAKRVHKAVIQFFSMNSIRWGPTLTPKIHIRKIPTSVGVVRVDQSIRPTGTLAILRAVAQLTEFTASVMGNLTGHSGVGILPVYRALARIGGAFHNSPSGNMISASAIRLHV